MVALFMNNILKTADLTKILVNIPKTTVLIVSCWVIYCFSHLSECYDELILLNPTDAAK